MDIIDEGVLDKALEGPEKKLDEKTQEYKLWGDWWWILQTIGCCFSKSVYNKIQTGFKCWIWVVF